MPDTPDRQQNEQAPEPPNDPLQRALVQRGQEMALDISILSDRERREIVKQYQEGLIDVRLRADNLNIDILALDGTLRSLSGHVADVTADGNSATVSHTQDSAAGRTEIMIGNTQRAQTGRFSKSQTGEKDWTPYMIGGAVIAVIFAALIIASAL